MSDTTLDLISRINRTLSSGRDLSACIRESLDVLKSECGVSSIFLFVATETSERLSLTNASGLGIAEFRRLESVADSKPFRRIIEGRTVDVQESLRETADLEFLSKGTADDRLIAVPVIFGSRPIGVLATVAANQKKSGGDLHKLLHVIATMFGQAFRIERSVRGEREKLIEENSHLKQELKEKYDFTHIIGNSNPMKHVYDQVSQVARSNATVLLRGESGTGKEMIANAIHYNSLRSKKPLIKLNCAALPDGLIESELFGHEKGAFTGAERQKKGRFELADGGTLFLDEIGDIPLQSQIKLLRVLQEREYERVGSGETIKSNIRLIAATNKDLEAAIAAGEFREDLYYRLNVFSIFLPPLRERRSDILLLAEHFLEKYEVEHGKRIRRISTPAIDMLMAYHFPGNVRELENAIERAVLVCDSNVIHGHHLPPTLQTAEVSGTVTQMTLSSAVQAFERGLIQDTLKSTNGNVSKAAKQLDSTERILGYKIRKYKIDTKRFRR
ncbi:MAG: sigma 54-interacting transcriptional regulator [Acidobacteriota bacterium]